MATKRIKTAEATGPVLDWMVAKAKGEAVSMETWWLDHKCFSTDWAQCGLLIDEARIFLCPSSENTWATARTRSPAGEDTGWIAGSTSTEAVARCFVVSRLGEEVEVPEELT